MLKPKSALKELLGTDQPPSGGCVLKLLQNDKLPPLPGGQPPSGGCVLKHEFFAGFVADDAQPPSGGCVLKQNQRHRF